MTKRYFITTYGCQANVADSENVAGMLEALGMEECSSLDEANLIIVNTCSVRQASEDKVYGLANRVKKLKKLSSCARSGEARVIGNWGFSPGLPKISAAFIAS